ncbi:UNVERIFIED_CONTAM: Glutaredoxin-C9 [Sesamum angustifolium]|uniref:Glutaredoxin-C9 n=1 Tax=Sesamum angustifolium TaxID=2727405 RepID=A0AAW2K5Q6_9LAMI
MTGIEPAPPINGGSADLKSLVKNNAVIVFGRNGCCMSLVVKILLQSLGANPTMYGVEEKDVNDVVDELRGADDGGEAVQLPAVFIGGRWFGGLDRILVSHISEELTPLLKQAGALWL